MKTKEYNECVRLYSDRLYGYAIKQTRNDTEAKDVIQDVFEKLWRKIDRIPYEACPAILFRMVYNQIIDTHRYNKVRKTAVSNMDVQKYTVSSDRFEFKDLIDQAFLKLSDEYKSLVILKDLEGYSYKEIADIMTMSISQVKVYLFRARKQMQTELKSLELVKSN